MESSCLPFPIVIDNSLGVEGGRPSKEVKPSNDITGHIDCISVHHSDIELYFDSFILLIIYSFIEFAWGFGVLGFWGFAWILCECCV